MSTDFDDVMRDFWALANELFISLCYVIFNDKLEINFLSENTDKT